MLVALEKAPSSISLKVARTCGVMRQALMICISISISTSICISICLTVAAGWYLPPRTCTCTFEYAPWLGPVKTQHGFWRVLSVTVGDHGRRWWMWLSSLGLVFGVRPLVYAKSSSNQLNGHALRKSAPSLSDIYGWCFERWLSHVARHHLGQRLASRTAMGMYM